MAKRVSPARAMAKSEPRPPSLEGPERQAGEELPAVTDRKTRANGREQEAVEWAAAHLAEREAVLSRTALLSAALA